MDFQDLDSRVEGGVGELYLSVDSAGSQQSRIEDVDSVGSHDDLDSLGSLEPVQLIEKLKHSPLHLGISPLPLHSRATDRVDLIDENYAGRVLSGHNEQLSDHPRSLSNIFLHQLGSRHPDESTVSVMSNGPCEKGFSCSWRSIHQNSLGLGYSQRLKDFGVLDGKFNDLLDLLNLLIKSSDHIVGGIWHFLYLHEGNKRIDLCWQNFVQNVVIGPDCDSEVGLDVLNFDGLVNVDDVLPLVAQLNIRESTLTRTLFLPITFTTSPT